MKWDLWSSLIGGEIESFLQNVYFPFRLQNLYRDILIIGLILWFIYNYESCLTNWFEVFVMADHEVTANEASSLVVSNLTEMITFVNKAWRSKS